MPQIGDLEGVGSLIVNGEEFKEVRYSINAEDQHSDNDKTFVGEIKAPADALWKLFHYDEAFLRLENNTDLRIVHIQTDVGASIAKIRIKDKVPGL